jgi:hypothetical protein
MPIGAAWTESVRRTAGDIQAARRLAAGQHAGGGRERPGNFGGGRYPLQESLALGADGMLFGICEEGGQAMPQFEGGMGTVFRIAP